MRDNFEEDPNISPCTNCKWRNDFLGNKCSRCKHRSKETFVPVFPNRITTPYYPPKRWIYPKYTITCKGVQIKSK